MVEAQLGRTDIEATRGLHEAYWQGYFSKMKPDAGCIELLTDLRASRVRVALVSNYTTERQMLKMRALGLERVTDVLITSEEVGTEKPSPAALEYALARLRVRSGEAWMVGDNLKEDIGAARVLGLTAVWFQRSECEDAGEVPDFIVSDWFELRELLDRERNH
jgi:putative hydrolase of the HAD superfamily